MENTSWLDLVFGGVALLILIGGLFMLFKGLSLFESKEK